MASLRAPLQFFSLLHLRGAQRLALAALLATPVLLSGQSGSYDQGPPPDQSFDQIDQVDQDFSDNIPANLYVVDGVATLERDGTSQSAAENTPLLAGDRIRTARGRVEVLFSDGSVLDVDENSTVDLQSDALMRLLAGQVRLSIARSTVPIEYRVDAVSASALIRQAGDYRVSLSQPRGAVGIEVDLAVIRGAAELENPDGRTLVRAGTHAVASSQLAPSLPIAFYTASTDDFDRWSEDRRDERLGVNSTRYLPAEAQYYGGAMDRDGDWNYDTSYGYVWYPRVSVDWRPYSVGRWSYFSTYGWTWIGADRWSWPTHHYGRWGLSGSRWFWIPDRRWGPAWVSWATSPGYVSWCPLGISNRPVIALSHNYVSQPWTGWTVLSAGVFSSNVIVTGRAVGRNVPVSVWTSLSGSRRGPLARGPAISAPPLRGPGNFNRAVPRYGNTNAIGGDRRTSAPPRDPGMNRKDVRTPTPSRQDQYSQPNDRAAPQRQSQPQPQPQPTYTPRGDVRNRGVASPDRGLPPSRSPNPTVGAAPAPRTQVPRGDVRSPDRTQPPNSGVTPVPNQPSRNAGQGGGEVRSRGDVRRSEPPPNQAPPPQSTPSRSGSGRSGGDARSGPEPRQGTEARPGNGGRSGGGEPRQSAGSRQSERSGGSQPQSRVSQPPSRPSGPPPSARSQPPSGARTPPSNNNNSSSNGSARRRGGG